MYSVDEFSGGEALVSALLQDPFSPEVENVRITSRWESRGQDTRLDIEYASFLLTYPILIFLKDTLHLPS